MIRSAVRNTVAAAVPAAILSSVAACDGGPPAPPGSDDLVETGKVSLPLLTTTNDHVYRLSGVYIVIYGPQFAQLFSSDDPAETALSTTLQTGSYAAYLVRGTLERSSGHDIGCKAKIVDFPKGSAVLREEVTAEVIGANRRLTQCRRRSSEAEWHAHD